VPSPRVDGSLYFSTSSEGTLADMTEFITKSLREVGSLDVSNEEASDFSADEKPRDLITLERLIIINNYISHALFSAAFCSIT